MTVTFTQEVAINRLGTFFKLLFRWRGSIYKLLWKDFVLFVVLYYAIRFLYRSLLSDTQQRSFEGVCEYMSGLTTIIPLSLVLAFYMQFIFKRWQNVFSTIAWPDRMALLVTANIKGLDDRGRLLRRTVMRYLMIGYVMNLRSICSSVKRRFPTLEHLTRAGLMTSQEEHIIEGLPQNKVNKYCVPFVWAVDVIGLARKEGRIFDDYAVYILNQELSSYRKDLGILLRYDTVTFPLISTQTVTIAVYMWVLFSLFGRQFLILRSDRSVGETDLIVNVGALLHVFLYVGWLKLAEMTINPFGDDDDDFDMNVLIDRNIQYSYLIVDDLHADLPPLAKDMYWDQEYFTLPYTEAVAAKIRSVNPEIGSADAVRVSDAKSAFVATPLSPRPFVRELAKHSQHLHQTDEVPLVSTADLRKLYSDELYRANQKHLKISGMLSKTADTVLNPKKLLQSVEHQFRTTESHVQPFDNRFQEVDYDDERVQDFDDENYDQELEEEMNALGMSFWRTSATFASGAYSGLRKIVGMGVWAEKDGRRSPSPPPSPPPSTPPKASPPPPPPAAKK